MLNLQETKHLLQSLGFLPSRKPEATSERERKREAVRCSLRKTMERMLLGPTGFLGHAVSGSELFTEGESVVQLPILFSLGGTQMNSFPMF